MRNCAHCGREVAADKQFCGYCGYRADNPEIETKEQSPAQDKLAMAKPNRRVVVGVVLAAIIIISSLVTANIYFPFFEDSNPDADGDGITDSEDDYPNDADFSAKLTVIDSNWYTVNNTIFVVIEFKNPKNYDLSWVQTDISLTSSSGEEVRKDNTVLWSGNILHTGERAYSFWHFEDVGPGVEGYQIEVKGENYKGNNNFNYPRIELINNQGSLSEAPNQWGFKEYLVTGQVKNLDDEEQVVSTWVGYYNTQGKLLDVNFDVLPVIAPGTSEHFEILSNNPMSADIWSFNVHLVVEFI
jgi:hypothetical protein